MKYEDWIKYEEIRQKQPDKLAWITSPDLNPDVQPQPLKVPEVSDQSYPSKRKLWGMIFQRFISRRI